MRAYYVYKNNTTKTQPEVIPANLEITVEP